MKHRLLHVLCCPACRGDLALEHAVERFGEVESGELACRRCKASYPVVGYIPRFVEGVADPFETQRLLVRKHFRDYARDRSGDLRLGPYTGFDLRSLKRGLTLEAGCGYGRFLNPVSLRGGEVVGLDLSAASLDIAFDWVGRRPKVHLVQADIFRMPFKDGAFARAFAIGVLNRTASPRAGLEAIARTVAPGGQLSAWVHHPGAQEDLLARWRSVTAGLPPRVLYALCVLNQVLLGPLRKVPRLGGLISRLVPGNWPEPERRFWQRVIGDFDSLSRTHESVHEPGEVATWFEELGYESVVPLDVRTAVTGIRPAGRAAHRLGAIASPSKNMTRPGPRIQEAA